MNISFIGVLIVLYNQKGEDDDHVGNDVADDGMDEDDENDDDACKIKHTDHLIKP